MFTYACYLSSLSASKNRMGLLQASEPVPHFTADLLKIFLSMPSLIIRYKKEIF